MEPVKIFLSHASEDQPDFVRPLAESLSSFSEEFRVWYSEYELTIGDRLLAKIDEGLKGCDYGAVVLSPHFFAKRWPREELEGLFQLETTERKVILPIWKDVSEAEVKEFSPILAGRLGANASAGIPAVVEDIRRAVGLVDRYKELASPDWKAKLQRLDRDIAHRRRVEEFGRSQEAVELVSRVALEIVDSAWATGEEMSRELSAMKLQLATRKADRTYFVITGPKRLMMNLTFISRFVNSIDGCALRLIICRWKDDWEPESETQILEQHRFQATFDNAMNVIWTDESRTFGTGKAFLDFAFERFVAALIADK